MILFVMLRYRDTFGNIGAYHEIWSNTVYSWVERIKSRMQELDLTHEDLAAKLGITRGAVTHYLTGRRVPPLRQFQKLAVVLKTDPAWLQFGTTSTVQQKGSASSKKEAKPEVKYHPIPMLTWEKLATKKELKSNEHLPHLFTDKPHWYALRVQGDAMVGTKGNKSFHEGDIIVVDPDKTAKQGDFVVAILPKAKEATFKQYVIEGGITYLKPLNQQYPMVAIDKKTVICGVVVW